MSEVMVMAETVMDAQKLRKLKRKSKHPKFFRSNFKRRERKRVKAGWKKPRGIDNKKRDKQKTYGAEPTIGYGSPRAIRGMHPSGMMEERVFNAKMLASVPKHAAVRIAAAVGARKRAEIEAKAKELGLRVLN